MHFRPTEEVWSDKEKSSNNIVEWKSVHKLLAVTYSTRLNAEDVLFGT